MQHYFFFLLLGPVPGRGVLFLRTAQPYTPLSSTHFP